MKSKMALELALLLEELEHHDEQEQGLSEMVEEARKRGAGGEMRAAYNKRAGVRVSRMKKEYEIRRRLEELTKLL